ncbi:MAG: hypothetical protein QOE36_454, partial [Gaiellaceae bacterium]|nr:hypothetical protein [Gaiellaceae bacterium]
METEPLAERYARLALETPARGRDGILRALDIGFAGLFLVVSLPLSVPLAVALLATSGRPLFYRGERVGRGGRVFEMRKLRTLRAGAEERLGGHLGPELVELTRVELTPLGGWLRATQLDEIPQ